jgi:hypothetical protein
MGAAHRLALAGDAPDYAAHLPSCGGDGDEEAAWEALRELCASGRLGGEVAQPVQTNEARRTSFLLAGFSAIAAETGLPLRLLEVGCSAGLLLRFDRYRYDVGGATWGDPASPVCISVGAEGAPPLGPVEIASRRGCDPNPLDPVRDRLLLLGFIWPDQLERFRIADAALRLAAEVPVDIDVARAEDWLPEQLAEPVPGVTTVVYHSIVFQYLPREMRRHVRDLLRAAGERATREAPLAWLTYEPHKDLAEAELGVTIWPGGERRTLALGGFHGDPVRWLAA